MHTFKSALSYIKQQNGLSCGSGGQKKFIHVCVPYEKSPGKTDLD